MERVERILRGFRVLFSIICKDIYRCGKDIGGKKKGVNMVGIAWGRRERREIEQLYEIY